MTRLTTGSTPRGSSPGSDPAPHNAPRDWAPVVFGAGSLLGLILVVTAGAIFALLLALVTAEWRTLQAFDTRVVDAVNSAVQQIGPLVTAVTVITQLGSPLGVGIVITVAVIWLLIRRVPRQAAYMALTGLGAPVLAVGVKELIDRARPLVDVPLSSPTGASFPSGHSVAITIAWGALLLVFLPVIPPRFRKAATAGILGVIVLVGLSRIVLGVHYPSDVVGGWLLGGLWLFVTASAFRLSREDHSPGESPSMEIDATREESRAMVPAPAHDHPFPDGAATAARLVVAAVLLTGATIAVGLLIMRELAEVRRLDAVVAEWFVGLRGETLTAIAGTIGWLGGVAGIVTVLAIAIPLALAITRRWTPPLFLFVLGVGQGIVYLAASRLLARPRPEVEQLGGELLTQVSFPSGHVGAAAATYGGIAMLLVTGSRRPIRYAAIAIAVLIVLVVAFWRLYRGVHYPTDVAAGALYGLIWLAVCWRTMRPARRRTNEAREGDIPPTRRSGRQREASHGVGVDGGAGVPGAQPPAA